MDFLKNVSFSIALFLIGAIFLFLGLSGGFTVSNSSFTIQDALLRVISSIIGGILIAVAVYLEVKVRPTGEKASAETPATKGTTECVKRLRQLAAEFRVELNGVDRRSRLLSGIQAVELWTTLRCAPSCPQAPPRRGRRLTERPVWAD